MKVALINASNIVENIVMWDETCVAPEGLTPIGISEDAILSIGFMHNKDDSFTDPEPVLPAPEIVQPDLANLQSQLITLQAQIEALASAQKATKSI